MSPFVAPLARRGLTARRCGFVAVLTALLATCGLLYAPHGFLAASATAEQGTGADDFERADGPLGADWVADRGAWSIVGGSARSSGSPGNDVATYRPVQLGSRFAVTADVTLVSPTPAGREWAGIAANVHGTSSSLASYVLRVTTAGGTRPLGQWQLLTVTQSTSLAVVKSGEFNAPYGTPLTVSLSREATVFDIGVSRRDTGAALVDDSAELAVIDPNRVGGYAGLYSNSGNLRAQSFSVSNSVAGADDFERADGPLGADWVADRGAWSIVGGNASSSGSPGNDVATYRPVQLGSRFEVAADVTLVSAAPGGAEWGGIAANVYGTSSSLRSYVLRVTTAGGTRPLGRWQLLTVTQSTSLAVVKSGEFNAPYGTPLTVSLSRDARVFDIGVSRRDTGAVLVDDSAELAVIDPNRVGGYAGLYSNTGNLRAQSFSVSSSTPSESPPGPLDCVKEGDSYEFPSTDDVVLDESAIGRTWAGMSVTQQVLTRGDDQYVAFYNVNRDMVVAHRSLSDPAAVWTQKVLATRLGWDSHNYVTMGLDRDGQLHVSGNMHNVPLIYFRTDVAGDVTSLKRVPNMVSAGTENSVTYPEFVNRNDGSLVFSHRNGGSGDGVTYFNVYDENTHTWRRLLDVPLFDGSGTASNPGGTWNAYFEGPTLGPDGLFHMLWVWRDTPDAATNSILTYARSENLVDWFDSAGNPLDTPFKYGDGDIVDPVPNGGGLLNGNAKIGFDAGGAPLITYHKYDETGASQVYAARADGTGAWDVQQISDWDGRWQFGGIGSLSFDVQMRGAQVLDNGDVRVDFLCSNEEQSIVIDNDLRPLAQVPTPSLPNEVTGVRGTYPGLQVKFTEDLAGPQAPGTYYLRWETLPHNGDLARTSWPTEGGEISVVLVGP
jgi:hypothetical protein